MKRIKYIIALIALVCIGFNSQAQQNLNASKWTMYADNSGVQIYYKTVSQTPANADIREFIVLKLVNTSQQNVEVSWDLESWYGGFCRQCNVPNNGYNYSFQLSPGQTIDGSQLNIQGLNFLSRFPNRPNAKALTQFNLANLSIL